MVSVELTIGFTVVLTVTLPSVLLDSSFRTISSRGVAITFPAGFLSLLSEFVFIFMGLLLVVEVMVVVVDVVAVVFEFEILLLMLMLE